MKRNLNRRESRQAIENRENFMNSTGSLRGVEGAPTLPQGHRLNEQETERYLSDLPRMSYVVFSYDTPIAWETVDGWGYRVKQKFSNTTSQHMGLTFQSSDAKV